MTFEWFTNMFAFLSPKKKELKALPEIKIVKAENRDVEIVAESHEYLKKLKALSKLTKGLSCNERFEDVILSVSKVHNRCVADETVPMKRLEEYHGYYTTQFLNTFDKVLEPLMPKPEVDERLKAEYVLGNEEETISLDFETDTFIPQEVVEEVISNDPISINDLIEDLDPKKEDGYDSFSNGYASYMNEVFGFERKAKKTYNLMGNSAIMNYRLLYLGESNKFSQPILAEVIDIASNDGVALDSVCMIVRLDIDSANSTIVEDVSDFYNRDLINEIKK